MAALEKAITTQEELDALIGERLKRDRATYQKQFEKEINEKGWKSPEELKKLTDSHAEELKKLQDAAAETQKEMEKKDAAIAENAKYKTDLEKTRIALAAGLDQKYADRLKGENEEEWKKDAEELAKDFGSAHQGAPMGNPDVNPAATPEQAAQVEFGNWFKENFGS